MNALAKARISLNLKQKDLAEQVGLVQSTIGQYEIGARVPSIKTARKVVKALNDLGGNFTFDDVFPDDEQ